MLDIEVSSWLIFGCWPAEVFSFVAVVVLIFSSCFWLFVLVVFLSSVDVPFEAVCFLLGLSLLVSKEHSPKDLYPRKISPPIAGIEVIPPIAISNSLNAMICLR